MSTRHSPLRIASSLAILAFDWIIFAISITHIRYWQTANVVGAAATALVVALVERHAGATRNQLWLRGILGGLVVAMPLPVLGTVVALVSLLWSAFARDRGQVQRDPLG